MMEKLDGHDSLQVLIRAGIINHLLAIPNTQQDTEAPILEMIDSVFDGPVIRVSAGHYALDTDAQTGFKICQSLAATNGTLRGLSLAGDATAELTDRQIERVRQLLDATVLSKPKTILNLDFLIRYSALPVHADPTPAFAHIAQKLAEMEKRISNLATPSDIDQALLRIQQPEGTAPSDIQTILAAVAELTTKLETTESELVSKVTMLDEQHWKNWDAAISGYLQENLKQVTALLYNAGQKSETLRVDIDTVAHQFAAMKTSEAGARMELISNGEKLSQITLGLQKVLHRMSRQSLEVTSHSEVTLEKIAARDNKRM